MADRELGFEIKGVFYPQPTAFRLMDTRLIREATGMKMSEFSRGLEEDDWDELSLVGMVAVAVAQKNKTWSREKVLDFLNNIAWEDLQPVGGEDAGDDGPPAVTEEETPGLVKLPGLSDQSQSDSDSTSEQQSQTSSGSQLSATGRGS